MRKDLRILNGRCCVTAVLGIKGVTYVCIETSHALTRARESA